MTTRKTFAFYFEKAGRSAAQGAVHPAAQFFEGSDLEVSLVRETAQNAIDAASGTGPVTMVFDLRMMETAKLPDIDGLRPHLVSAAEATAGKHGHESMLRAVDASNHEFSPILRISDYGTKGLHGSESLDHPDSPLSALTRGAGISANDGTRGGSFGIGSAVGPMASDLSTVFYTSLPSDPPESDVVFAGYCQLASHKDENGEWRTADGFFTELDNQDFNYLRAPKAFGPFPVREEPGTDIYIPAYRMASSDPSLSKIRNAFVLNFMLAINRGRLIVKGRTESLEWMLDASTLASYAAETPEALALYRAIKDPNPIIGHHKDLGEMRLYINVDDSLERSYHTMTVRAPLMKIETYRHNSISAKYAAVFECSNSKGNRLLRALEPPEHTKWDPGRAEYGGSYVKHIKKFIKEGLKSRIRHQVGEMLEIKGLEKYLPAELAGPLAERAGGTRPAIGDGTSEQSATVQGKQHSPAPIEVNTHPKRSVAIRVSASTGGEAQISKGQDRGGIKNRRGRGGDLEGRGDQGDGESRINTGNVAFRSWYAGQGKVDIVLSAKSNEEGDLELLPLGPGGDIEEKYVLPITEVAVISSDGQHELRWTENTIHGLRLSPNERVRVRVSLSDEKRYRLGVK